MLAPSALISAQRPRECVQNYAKMLPSGGSSRQYAPQESKVGGEWMYTTYKHSIVGSKKPLQYSLLALVWRSGGGGEMATEEALGGK